MTTVKIIKTKTDYQKTLQEIERLVDKDLVKDSDEANRLELLAMLASKYEQDNFSIELPDPISAIKFRMDQLDMKPVDLEPYVGSLSRVSEILSGKRQLTKRMIQALHEGLGIPLESLISQQSPSLPAMLDSWPDKLANIMEERGYFIKLPGRNIKQKLSAFFGQLEADLSTDIMSRQSGHRLSPLTDQYAKIAWSARVISRANQTPIKSYIPTSITPQVMTSIAKLSVRKDGPLEAQKALADKGIALIFEPHLPKTRLDGAVLRADNGQPVIGLTLRHNRLDNFWFTLMHELAHISLHYDGSDNQFWDELQIKGLCLDNRESEADQLAQQALVPDKEWLDSDARQYPTESNVRKLADKLGVDVAIVIGRVRFENQNWSILSSIVNTRTVRDMVFDEL